MLSIYIIEAMISLQRDGFSKREMFSLSTVMLSIIFAVIKKFFSGAKHMGHDLMRSLYIVLTRWSLANEIVSSLSFCLFTICAASSFTFVPSVQSYCIQCIEHFLLFIQKLVNNFYDFIRTFLSFLLHINWTKTKTKKKQQTLTKRTYVELEFNIST